jgi:ribosomal protein S18 acetylase RimI-like enzyme
VSRSASKGKGFAKKLLKASLGVLSRAGYEKCCLVVTEGNEPAYSIYKSLGFEVKHA